MGRLAISLLVLAVCAFLAQPATAQEIFYSSDFESDDGGWAGTGDWEWGVVSTTPDMTGCFKAEPDFPAGANSGTNAWATDLDGCHSPNTTSELTQTFDLTNVSGNVQLCWAQYINTGGNSFDQARVFANGAELRFDDGSSGDAYEDVCVSLDAFSGNASVEVMYQLTTTGTVERSGWYIDDVEITADQIPVELTSFDAQVDGSDVLLTWETASETNNAGFEVQMKSRADWSPVAFVDGHGTTTEAQTYSHTVSGLLPGAHTFRLKQIDFDGAFEYSFEVEATVGVPSSHVLTQAYPNPFNPQARFELAVAQTQHVDIALYNTLGQQVAVVYGGTLEADQTQTFTIDGADLASGVYLVRVTGERFAETMRVTLAK